TADPMGKCAAAAEAALSALETQAAPPPDRPARLARPTLVAPGATPRRRLGSATGRAALLHALAHIELNAVDLAFDLALRFVDQIEAEGLDPTTFARDWIAVGAEEAAHFRLLADRLAFYGAAYGDFPAHDGLWSAAERTRQDVLARLAIAPMVLEARGLDVTPEMAARLESVGDQDSAAAIRRIYEDEIGHVATGVNWFRRLAARRRAEPVALFHSLVKIHFDGGLKPPFNGNARSAAGLSPEFYTALVVDNGA
ncbi:MAG: ferritin-like domain-containing protein, partial [Parvularculaceae bacterium]|nr:ferritin-like domain-containing protein [Parvularculaceae bacterium]